MRIAAGEEVCDVGEFRRLMDVGGIDVAQVDVTRVGGLARSKRIGWDSAERHRLCVNHSYKTGINIAASLHFVAALPNTHYFEYCVEQGAATDAHEAEVPRDRRRHHRPRGAGAGDRAG
jgi:L-alanine-DL-glutamate epimerase-like enolase superfamily enzyme